MPELPDERQIMDKGWNPEVYSCKYLLFVVGLSIIVG